MIKRKESLSFNENSLSFNENICFSPNWTVNHIFKIFVFCLNKLLKRFDNFVSIREFSIAYEKLKKKSVDELSSECLVLQNPITKAVQYLSDRPWIMKASVVMEQNWAIFIH